MLFASLFILLSIVNDGGLSVSGQQTVIIQLRKCFLSGHTQNTLLVFSYVKCRKGLVKTGHRMGINGQRWVETGHRMGRNGLFGSIHVKLFRILSILTITLSLQNHVEVYRIL